MPSSKLLLHAEELRARAEELLVQAETFHDPDSRQKMREVAAIYEKLAERLEQQGATRPLAGKRILIVEDERAIAENIAFEIAAQGGKVVGPVASADAALHTIATTRLDGAIVDIKLMGKMTFSVADVLADRHIPFLFVTGYSAQIVPPSHANVHRLQKPVTPFTVCRALEAAMFSPP
jgi:CheY-like chemotaxis protein